MHSLEETTFLPLLRLHGVDMDNFTFTHACAFRFFECGNGHLGFVLLAIVTAAWSRAVRISLRRRFRVVKH
jgi:hypothetical protein